MTRQDYKAEYGLETFSKGSDFRDAMRSLRSLNADRNRAIERLTGGKRIRKRSRTTAPKKSGAEGSPEEGTSS